MSVDDQIEDNHKVRSRFIRRLIQNPTISKETSSIIEKKIQKKIVQFWDRLDALPSDVKECIDTWKEVENQGFERLLFDNQMAREYIYKKMGRRYLDAFNKCYHPAMQSDYFRLCYIYSEGGCYVDADDVYTGAKIQNLFKDGRLKVQPLCYDIASNTMVSSEVFSKTGIDDLNWIFYFNNNPIIASSGHPIIETALNQATQVLERETADVLPEIQSTAGPGNLSSSIFKAVLKNIEMEQSLFIMCRWEDIAQSKWELDYRNDARNWRNSNCRKFLQENL